MTRGNSSPSDTVSVNDRLLTTLFLAGLFHLIIILGITFAPPAHDPALVPTLEVMLVSDALPETPVNERASYLSQRTQQGSGNLTSGATQQPGAAGEPEDSPEGVEGGTGTPSLAGPAGGEAGILTGAGSRSRFIADATDPANSLPSLPQLALAGQASPEAGAGDDDALELKGVARSELLVTPSTRASDVAVYLDAWKHRVEQVGTLNFPNEARRRHLSGNPVIEVALASNGDLVRARVRRTSGHAELDRAAISILRLAAPFEGFPAELAARHDMLRFAYEWQFVAGRLAGSAVEVPAP
jgi:protein TonB